MLYYCRIGFYVVVIHNNCQISQKKFKFNQPFLSIPTNTLKTWALPVNPSSVYCILWLNLANMFNFVVLLCLNFLSISCAVLFLRQGAVPPVSSFYQMEWRTDSCRVKRTRERKRWKREGERVPSHLSIPYEQKTSSLPLWVRQHSCHAVIQWGYTHSFCPPTVPAGEKIEQQLQ